MYGGSLGPLLCRAPLGLAQRPLLSEVNHASSVTAQESMVMVLSPFARAAQAQATVALIVSFARRQWGNLAGRPCEIVAVHLYRVIEFSAERNWPCPRKRACLTTFSKTRD